MLEPKTHLCLTSQKPYQPQPYLNCQGLPRPRSLAAVTFKGCDTGLRLLRNTTLSLSEAQKEVLFPPVLRLLIPPAHPQMVPSRSRRAGGLIPADELKPEQPDGCHSHLASQPHT